MRVRTMRFQTRNPVVAIGLLLVVLAVLAALLTVGLAIAAGLAVFATAAVLARRAFGRRLPPPEPPRLDRSREVFARRADPPALPPGDDRTP